MGEVCFNFYPNPYSGMDIPFQLDYPNNGFLLDNTPFTWGPQVSTGSNTYTQSGTAAYTGYGAGVVVTVNTNVVITYQQYCGRTGCHLFPVDTLTGGTGVVTFNPICGNGIVESGEQCDDGAANGTASSCCTATCTFQALGTPCTGGTCDGVDTCLPGATTTTTSISTGTTSTTLVACGATPASGCQPAAAQRAQLLLGNGKLAWKWTSSGAVATTDFGSPPTTTDYLLCIYDASGERLSAPVAAGGMCGTRPCWKALGTIGFKYADMAGKLDGLTKVLLKAGSGRGKLGVNGAGPNLLLPTLPLTLPVTVQLQQDASSACWEATYGTATTNTPSAFKAKSD
jgi:cysteine-rich repeat protein